jgi:sodium transport system permease protein
MSDPKTQVQGPLNQRPLLQRSILQLSILQLSTLQLSTLQLSILQLRSVIKKELLDARRDSKSLATALLMPIIFVAQTQSESQGFTLPIQGLQQIAPVVDWLEESGITVVEAPEDAKSAILNKTWPVIISVPDQFSEQFRAQKRARIDILSDHSDPQAQAKANRIRQLLAQWSAANGALRLIARNISPDLANSLELNAVNVTSEQRLSSKIIGSLPLIIMLIAFVGGVGMSSDMAAGERERKSLEPLLINPVRRDILFLGKWSATVLISFVITCFGLALQFLSVHLAPLAQLGLRIDLNLGVYGLILLILIPVIFLASALQLLVSLFARSFKDSQSYNSLVMLIPMLPGLYVMFNAKPADLGSMFIPLLGPQTLLVDLIAGDPVAPLHLIVSASISLLVAFILGGLGVMQLKRERMIAG